MKKILSFLVCISFLIPSFAQIPPQKVNNWYEFLGESNDTLLQLPAKLATQSAYRVPRSMYYNVGDSTHIHLWTGFNDIAIGGGSGGSGTVTGLHIGALDSLSPVLTGAQVINNTTLPVVYLQSVKQTGFPGLLGSTDYNHFETTYQYFHNTSPAEHTLVWWPDSATHNFGSSSRLIVLGDFAASSAGASNQKSVYVGFATAESCTNCQSDVWIGDDVGANVTTSNGQVFIGNNSCNNCVAGSQLNTTVGASVFQNAKTPVANTVIGNGAVQNCTSCSYNAAGGQLSENRDTSATRNADWGYGTNSGCTNCHDNASLGFEAGDFNTQGNFNTNVGSQAHAQDSVGNYNISVGVRSLTGFNNQNCIAIGDSSLYGNYPNAGSGTRGSNRTIAVGNSISVFSSGNGTDWINSILIGNNISPVSLGDTGRVNDLVIGDGIQPDTDNLAIIGRADQVIRFGNGGMTQATFNAQPVHASNMQFISDAGTYEYTDGSNSWKWRQVLTGSVSQTVSAATTITVTLPVTLGVTSYNVNISPTSAVAAIPWFISTKGTTSFVVNFTSAITGTATFDYTLILQ